MVWGFANRSVLTETGSPSIIGTRHLQLIGHACGISCAHCARATVHDAVSYSNHSSEEMQRQGTSAAPALRTVTGGWMKQISFKKAESDMVLQCRDAGETMGGVGITGGARVG